LNIRWLLLFSAYSTSNQALIPMLSFDEEKDLAEKDKLELMRVDELMKRFEGAGREVLNELRIAGPRAAAIFFEKVT
jgi:hypothetical protein